MDSFRALVSPHPSRFDILRQPPVALLRQRLRCVVELRSCFCSRMHGSGPRVGERIWLSQFVVMMVTTVIGCIRGLTSFAESASVSAVQTRRRYFPNSARDRSQ